jgi:acetate kinase
MNTLVLNPSRHHLDFTCFPAGQARTCMRFRSAMRHDPAALAELLREVRRQWFTLGASSAPSAIGIRAVFGGEAFRQPAILASDTLERVRRLSAEAPLHIPLLVRFLEESARAFPDTPIVLLFETAFFVDLPLRERLYGLEAEVIRARGLRRYGFHGLFHEAAVLEFARESRRPGRRRVLSVCLEPKPEVAAVIGRRPVMVTGGSTPLAGLPGHTSCGELDPSVALKLADTLQTGVEGADWLLAKESGLKGLTGRPVTLEELFHDEQPDVAFARQVMEYQLLCAAGAGVAAMGGLDGIIFSGRFSRLGGTIGPRLKARLTFRRRGPSSDITLHRLDVPLDRIVAETALAVALSAGRPVAAT